MLSPKLDFLTTGYGPLVQVIYDRISDEILDLRRLDATTPIMEDVAEEHGATMMNVHRAFETLSSDGLVRYDRTCGTATVNFGETDVIELTRSRLKLEIVALQNASFKSDKSAWHSMAQWPHNPRQDRALNLRYSQHVRFYCGLFEPLKCDVTTNQFIRSMDNFQKYLYHLWRDTAVFDEHMQDAETTLRLCLEGAREPAWDAHSRHIEKTRDHVLANLERRNRDQTGFVPPAA